MNDPFRLRVKITQIFNALAAFPAQVWSDSTPPRGVDTEAGVLDATSTEDHFHNYERAMGAPSP